MPYYANLYDQLNKLPTIREEDGKALKLENDFCEVWLTTQGWDDDNYGKLTAYIHIYPSWNLILNARWAEPLKGLNNDESS